MARCGRVIRWLNTRKSYICVLIFMCFGLTYVQITNKQDTESKTDTRFLHGRLGGSYVDTSNDSTCECETDKKKSTDLQWPHFRPGLSTGTQFTVAGFKSRAKTDPAFLQKLLDQNYLHTESKEVIRCFLTDTKYPGFELYLNDPVPLQENYDINKDTFVFLHIQKTGGTFFNSRLKSLSLPFPCKCDVTPCESCRPGNGNVWVYTWKITGWKCGLHSDWAQLHRCIPDMVNRLEGKQRTRRFFYITQLRDPIERYLSEWNHQSKRHHWQDSFLWCGDGLPRWGDVRPCFIGENWHGVSLDEFMACPHNLATNRQARMLADLTLSDCYKGFTNNEMKIKRAYSWIKSAINNLKQMEYFGIFEELQKSDYMFHDTFGLQLNPQQGVFKHQTHTITEDQFFSIISLVELDIHIYMFAKELFHRRALSLNIDSS